MLLSLVGKLCHCLTKVHYINLLVRFIRVVAYAKVTELNLTVLGHQYVLQFDVSMQNVFFMNVRKRLLTLVTYVDENLFRKRVTALPQG